MSMAILSELCGGTHVDNTAKIGLFKIISENSVASGIRRIEAVTGGGVLELVNDINGLLNKVAAVFKVSNPAELVAKGEAIHNELKAKDAELALECGNCRHEDGYPTRFYRRH